MNVNEKIKKLREEMKRIGVQAYIIPGCAILNNRISLVASSDSA